MKRRTFLKLTWWGGVGAYLVAETDALASFRESATPTEEAFYPTYDISHISSVEVIRPDDLLNLRFEFANLALVRGVTLERINKTREALIRVIFPPQHISEQSFKEEEQVTPPVGAYIAGPSRLVFKLPTGVDAIPYTLKSLLSWAALEPSIVPAAYEPTYQPGSHPISEIIEPGPNHSQIEAPKHLFLSPHQVSAWAHSDIAFTRPVKYASAPAVPPGGSQSSAQALQSTPYAADQSHMWILERTELWHTRLGVKSASSPNGVDERRRDYRTVRAVYSSEYDNDDVVPDYYSWCHEERRTEVLTADNRKQIVHLSSDVELPFRKSIQVNRLMLSPLGAWLDLQGDWTPADGSGYGLQSWTHRAVMGRDSFVRVVEKGYLFPFGHRASKITITERRFGNGTAPLRYFAFVVVREPEKRYPKDITAADAENLAGRAFPFGRVRITTLVTPHLNPMPDDAEGGWLQQDNKDLLFKLEAEDWDGNICEFLAPLYFVPGTSAESVSGFINLPCFHYHYYDEKPERRKSLLHGQTIAYAPSRDSSAWGAASFETESLVFGHRCPPVTSPGKLRFLPEVKEANVRLSAACQIAGKDLSVTLTQFPLFLQYGFGPGNDKGEIFAQVEGHVPLIFSAAQSGGVAAPNMNIRGLSRCFGVVGGPTGDTWKKDLEALAAFDMSKAPPVSAPNQPDSNYFTRLLEGATLLGDISLGDIIDTGFENGKNIPKFQTLKENGVIVHRFTWTPSVRRFKAFRPNQGSTFELKNETRQTMDGGEPVSLTRGVLKNFSLDLVPHVADLATITFGSFSFTSRNGAKPDFDIQGLTFEFKGPLKVLNNLAALLSGDRYQNNFSDPPSVNVTAGGIQLGYTLSIPDIACGSFLMKNVAFSAGVTLPFNAPLSVGLAFASRDNPFTLAVYFLGGGGYFGLDMGTSKLNSVDGALECGAIAEINFGPAQGGVYAMMGVYFMIAGDDVSLTAYFRCGGEVSVLDLISASIEIYIGLTYDGDRTLSGHGEVEVEVDVAFFSKTVTIGMDKSFDTAALTQDRPIYAGLPFLGEDGAAHPPLESYWAAYGAAFAGAAGGAA